MSIRRVFSQVNEGVYKQLPRPSTIIPRPKNLSKNTKRKDKFLQSILPNARTRGGKTSGVCAQINGEWSSGKTLFLAFIAQERWDEEEVKGICNYPLTIKDEHGKLVYERMNDDFKRIDSESGEELYGIDALTEVYNSIVQIDELQRYTDSYMSRSQRALFTANITADFGKQGNDFYYTNQHHNAAPTRIRVNISFVVYPQYDDQSGWVHVYLFHSISKFLWKDPFWYFGFYAPDYWNAYDTKYKIEDYVPKFRTEPYIRKFLDWIPSRKIKKSDIKKMQPKKFRNTLKLFDATEGHDLSSPEITLILTDMEYQGLWNG